MASYNYDPEDHPKWCCCSDCVRAGRNQKSLSAPDDHESWCRCDKCMR